jgi:hypothetical protein
VLLGVPGQYGTLLVDERREEPAVRTGDDVRV